MCPITLLISKNIRLDLVRTIFWYVSCLFLKLAKTLSCLLLPGLAPTDLETYDQPGNGAPDGVNAEAESINVSEDVKEEEEATAVNKPKHVMTNFEMEGLWNLLGKLEELPDHKKCVPDGIRNPSALLNNIKVGAHHLMENPQQSGLFCCVLMFVLFHLYCSGCTEAVCSG